MGGAIITMGRIVEVNGGPIAQASTISYTVRFDTGRGSLTTVPNLKPLVRPPAAEPLEVHAFEVDQLVKVLQYENAIYIDQQEYPASEECPTGGA